MAPEVDRLCAVVNEVAACNVLIVAAVVCLEAAGQERVLDVRRAADRSLLEPNRVKRVQ